MKNFYFWRTMALTLAMFYVVDAFDPTVQRGWANSFASVSLAVINGLIVQLIRDKESSHA